MQFSLLSEPLRVVGYLLFIIAAGSGLHFLWTLLVLFCERQEMPIPKKIVIRRQLAGFTVSAGCCLIFYYLMYMGFSGVGVISEELHLRYFWPKTERIIRLSDVSEIRMDTDQKHRGRLIIFSTEGAFYSINCPTDEELEPMKAELLRVIEMSQRKKLP